LYGAVAYAVSERRSELAVRLALGATRSDIVRLMLGDPLRTAAIGIVVGLPAVYGLMHALSSLLFGVAPFDVWTMLACAGGLLGIAAAAALLPARRAAGIDPLEALKCR
jgi:ABC-type antimicrobial peptide transport system permease subunit